jgi:type I restriction enzyme R subunit
MRNPGEIERRTQNRLVKLFRDQLGYDYLGNWVDRVGNSNIEDEQLRRWLTEVQGYEGALVTGALFELHKAAGNTSKSLYDRNHDVYDLLRYGVKVKPDADEMTRTVWLVDWDNPERNHFAVAEEVTVAGSGVGAHAKRPDLVIYVNGIALGIIELKRSTVSVAEGIRQNLDSQKREFIQPFFATVQLVMAGNDTEGLRYGVIETKERYYLSWKEPTHEDVENPLDRAVLQLFEKDRLLELIHDFVVFDRGIKKIARHNQYFGVQAAHNHVDDHEGGIIWHAQGSGKSLTMAWLTKWIHEHNPNARLLIVTDRIELDDQIEKVFLGVNEQIHRTTSGADLVTCLNGGDPWLMCSLIHKFGGREGDEDAADVPGYLAALTAALPPGFAAKGDLFVFVDECHRTQSGDLHDAMKALLPNATFIGWTGTPLLRSDKKRSVETFGPYIHTYKFDEAVADRVILDLRYEARDIDQRLTSQAKIDEWFEVKTRGLTDLARAQLKRRWGTMEEIFSSQSRLEQIVADILLDMETRDRFASGLGNALLVSDSIYQACKFYELFSQKGLRGKVAIVTSYRPTASAIKGEESGEGETERLREYAIYRQMLADWFNEPADTAVNKVDEFEKAVKKKFIDEPGQMKLLIVVDKLLTGFDAPPATYLYIDKQMRDHGLFQAICRVNRLDTDDKEYGYIIDYKDLFGSLEGAVRDYTSGALDGYEREDVVGLLKDRLIEARSRLEEAREAVKALCEPVALPRDASAYLRFFCAGEAGDAEQLKANEPSRAALYRLVSSFIRAYANLAGEMEEAGYTPAEAAAIEAEVNLYEKVRTEVKLASGDYIDLKMYEPAMRHLIDTYIKAEDSTKVSAFDDLSLIDLIVQRGPEAVDALPDGIKESPDAVGDAIVNNVRRLIIDKSPVNPRYYERMSELLNGLIARRKQEALRYKDYLDAIVAFTRDLVVGPEVAAYPIALTRSSVRALYDNLGNDEAAALAVDSAVRDSLQDGWRDNAIKTRRVSNAVRAALADFESDGTETEAERQTRVVALIKSQDDY